MDSKNTGPALQKSMTRALFIESLIGNIKEKYFFEKKLGSGGYGAVYLAKNKGTGKFNLRYMNLVTAPICKSISRWWCASSFPIPSSLVYWLETIKSVQEIESIRWTNTDKHLFNWYRWESGNKSNVKITYLGLRSISEWDQHFALTRKYSWISLL